MHLQTRRESAFEATVYTIISIPVTALWVHFVVNPFVNWLLTILPNINPAVLSTVGATTALSTLVWGKKYGIRRAFVWKQKRTPN